jgi:hypothetical protein
VIPRVTAALAIACAIFGFAAVALALLATSEAGVGLFVGGAWLLVAASGLGLGWIVMRDRAGR